MSDEDHLCRELTKIFESHVKTAKRLGEAHIDMSSFEEAAQDIIDTEGLDIVLENFHQTWAVHLYDENGGKLDAESTYDYRIRIFTPDEDVFLPSY